jgi:hypothetical protein
VPYPNIWKKLEQKYNKPMEELLPEIATQAGSYENAAELLGVTTTTISEWARAINMRRICYYVVNNEPDTPAAPAARTGRGGE